MELNIYFNFTVILRKIWFISSPQTGYLAHAEGVCTSV